MKKLLLLLVMLNLFQHLLLAQTIITYNTYYLIPPSSGCNGLWAVGPYNPAECNTGIYSINPLGCATTSSTSGDTLFLTLCSIPCDFIAMDGTGGICLNCFLDYDFSTTVTESATTAFTLYPNPASTTISILPIAIGTMVNSPWSPDSYREVNIYNTQGQLVSHPLSRGECASLSAGKGCVLDISQLTPGLYYLHLQSAEGVGVKKFEVMR